MRTSDFDYELPPEFIAQVPIEPRDASRLLVLDRRTGGVEHAVFRDIERYLRPGDVLVLNQTRVIPARLFARKLPGGGKVEILLLRQRETQTWEVLVGGKGLVAGRRLILEGGVGAEIVAVLEGAQRLVYFNEPVDAFLEQYGHVPLPPYIHAHLEDPERYQTVYARQSGSAAAPTAGLHFTPELIEALQAQGMHFAQVVLHVGLDTFAPVHEDIPQEHRIHTEWCQLSSKAAQIINQASRKGGRIVAVGTTSVRTLETAARALAEQPLDERSLGDRRSLSERVQALEGPTDLFILPGYQFRAVDVLLTNFHLPRSTLIMLVSAFAGRERILAAYDEAKREGYRFYSFGDAMLIL